MRRLRILVVHNRYLIPGGEDAMVHAEVELLRRHDHDVVLYQRDNRELESMGAVEALAHTLWSARTWHEVGRLMAFFHPHLIHAHNTFPLVSPSLYWVAARAGVPIVQTLHNFRLLCVQAMFLHGNRVCEDCLGRLPWRGIARRCYRNSAVQSSALTAMLCLHRSLGTYRSKVTHYIALNEFCRRKFIAGGLPAARITVKPNFVDVPPPPDAPRHGGLFVGRLSPEKGIDTLLAALDELPGMSLELIGTGPEQAKVKAHPGVRTPGWLDSAAVYKRMWQASYLVLPSLWYENFPRTVVEAFAHGLPVIASRLGAMAELIEHGRTGLLFEPGSAQDLARHLAWAEAFPKKMRAMGQNARAEYEAKYTPEKNYERLMEIYENAMAEMRTGVAA